MRAAVYRRFGGPDTVRVEELPRPSVGPDDVLVRVHASTVSAADHRARSREVPRGLWLLAAFGIGAFRPKRRVLGMDVAGVVEAVGPEVTRFAPGDEVIGLLGARFGGHAEYARLRQDGVLAPKPRTMSFEDAVTLVFGGLTARGFLARTDLGPGASVLVNGASGAVGTAAVQLAKHVGAHVTGVCSGANHELVTSLGADRVIDYTIDDFTAEADTYDVIVDCVGNAPFERVQHLLTDGGALLLVIADLRGVLRAPWRSRRPGRLVTADAGKPTAEDLAFLVGLAEAGSYRAVRDRTYDLADIAEAHRFVDTGRKRGNVVVRMPDGGSTPSPTEGSSSGRTAPTGPLRGWWSPR
jgi:NADPH:quinone reductase-like Zn-dependent oxidoreductase